MAEFPGYGNVLDEAGSITPGSLSCGTGMLLLVATVQQTTSAVWPAANLAVFYSFAVEAPVTVYRLSCQNGATVNGNVDMGIYDVNGNRLVSIGSTAQTGTSTIQTFDITDTVLTPGLYYLAIASDSATATFLTCTNFAMTMRVCGMQQMSTAFPLPAPATFATYAQVTQPSVAAHFRSVV